MKKYWSTNYWCPDKIGAWLDKFRSKLQLEETEAFDSFAEFICMRMHDGYNHCIPLKPLQESIKRIIQRRTKEALERKRMLLEIDTKYKLIEQWNQLVQKLREKDPEAWDWC